MKQAKVMNGQDESDDKQSETLKSDLKALLATHDVSEVKKIFSFLSKPEGFEMCKTLALKPVYIKPTHILDPVHGHIVIDSRLFCIIDKPEFQRLRRIRQLGMAFF